MAKFGNPSGRGASFKERGPSSSSKGPSSDAKFKRSGSHGFLPRGTETGHRTRAEAEKAAKSAPNQDLYDRRVVEVSQSLAGAHFTSPDRRFVVVAKKRPVVYVGGQDDPDDARHDAEQYRIEGFRDVEVRRAKDGSGYDIYAVPPRSYVKGVDY